jgi:restriction endonuclease S subunit
MKLRKENWENTTIDAVSTEKSVRIDKPSESEYEKFVGLEHFVSGDLKLKNYGSTSDLNSAMKLFSKGDLLFARRNAYLKRASVADFEGVCSGDATVIEQNDKLINEFLVLIFNSSRFWNYSVSNAAGTMSKRVKWRDLAKYTFKLPPKDEQEKILNLFLTLEKQIEQTEEQEKNLLQTKRQLLGELFSNKRNFGKYLTAANYEIVSFGQIAQNISKRVEPTKTDLDIYIGLEHLDPDNLRIERQGVPADVKGVKLLMWEGDIIFGKRRAYQRKVAVSHFDGICSAHSMVLRANEESINKIFLPYFMQSDIFMDRAIQISEGSLSPTIKWKVLEKQEFVIPKTKFQNELTEVFKQFDNLIYELRDQNETLKKLKHKLLDEILG